MEGLFFIVMLGGAVGCGWFYNHLALGKIVATLHPREEISQRFFLTDFICLIVLFQGPFAVMGIQYHYTHPLYGPVMGGSLAILVLAGWFRATMLLFKHHVRESSRRAAFILFAVPLAWVGAAVSAFLFVFVCVCVNALFNQHRMHMPIPPILVITLWVLALAIVCVIVKYITYWVFQQSTLYNPLPVQPDDKLSSKAPGS